MHIYWCELSHYVIILVYGFLLCTEYRSADMQEALKKCITKMIIFSPSCCSKSVYDSPCGTQKKIVSQWGCVHTMEVNKI